MEEHVPVGFRLIDAMSFAVFLVIEVQSFAPCQMTVMHGTITVFLPLDVLFAALQTAGLSGTEPASDDSVVDAPLFIVETAVHFIDARAARDEGAGAVWHGESAQHGGKSSKGENRFHGV